MTKPEQGQVWKNSKFSIYIEAVESNGQYTDVQFLNVEDKDDPTAPAHVLDVQEFLQMVEEQGLTLAES